MSPTARRRRARRLSVPFAVPALTVPLLALPGVADAGSAGPPDDPTAQLFCVIAEVLNTQPNPPTQQQVAAYAAVAPEALAEPVALIEQQLAENDGNFMAIFGNPDVLAALDSLTAVEEEVCGIEVAGSEQDPSVTEIDESATRVDLTFADYEFVGELPTAAGRYSFVFANEGAEPHIAILLRVEDGATFEQVLASNGDEGVAEIYESSLGLPGGDPAVITADLGPGEWIMFCPIPDAAGVSHLDHGMIQTFTVS